MQHKEALSLQAMLQQEKTLFFLNRNAAKDFCTKWRTGDFSRRSQLRSLVEVEEGRSQLGARTGGWMDAMFGGPRAPTG